MTSITRAPIPKKARNRDAVPWRFTTANSDLGTDEVRAIAAVLMSGTEHHSLIQAYGGFGTTVFEGDFWASKGRGKDLSQVAKRWELVAERFPEYIVDAVLEYRVPDALRDFEETSVSEHLQAALDAAVPPPPPVES